MKKSPPVRKQDPASTRAARLPCVAGIGASAGGLEAIRGFFEAMPENSGIAFVVIQHLYPTQKSLAADIIGKYTLMPVIAAQTGMRVQADHVYTIPPNTYPALKDGALDFVKPPEHQGPRLPIDHFFASLGRDQQERAIGIILSGTGSDGAIGLKSIEANGGIVLCQSPETAQFDGMPASAIATGLVKYVLAVEKMPGILVGYASHPYVAVKSDNAAAQATSAALDDILDLVQAQRGHSFSGYKRSTLMRRVQRRMGLRSIVAWENYLVLLKRDPAEIDALFRDLFISVTEFFRDPEAWTELEQEIIKPLVDGKANGESIRVWVPGCATGEEAYSIAMLLLENVRLSGKHCPVQIFASDTNEESLALARAGRYPAGIAAQVSAERLRFFFTEKADSHHYQVSKELRDSVVFGKHNLASDPPYSRLDGICCRNLLIYLEAELQKKILSLFHFALRAGGFLFLGSAETGGSEEIFQPLSKKWRIFKHLGESKVSGTPLSPTAISEKVATAKAAETRRLPLRLSQLSALSQQIMLDRFTPAAVLINARFEVLYFSGPTEMYLQRPRGAPSHDLLQLLRDGLRSRLRSAVREAAKIKATVVISDARVKRDGKFLPVQLSVVPASVGEDGSNLFLVVFKDLPVSAAAGELAITESVLVHQLEEELHATKEDLQNTIERLETANEDLNASNEEIISVNEELQSINEELESSKEELQSLNEELSSVNQQLENKVVELETSNSDMKNLLASSEIATICLDPELRIKWFTPATKALCNIIPGDIGRSIGDFSVDNTGPELLADAAQVLHNPAPLQREMRLKDKRWFIRHMLPYLKEDESIKGVIVTYTDITATKRAADEAAQALRRMAESLEEQVRSRTTQLSALSTKLTLTEDRERRALAQDLHDDLGQVLAIVKIKLAALANAPDNLKEPLQEIDSLIDQANNSVRSLSLQLSPPVLYTLGLLPALEWLAEEMKRIYGLSVGVHDDGMAKPLDERQRITLFRAVRELLINVAKHAKVDRASVTSLCKDGHLTLAVSDVGCGFDYMKTLAAPAMKRGLGLLGVKERISLIGGEMNVDSRPGDCTTITLTAPLSPAEETL